MDFLSLFSLRDFGQDRAIGQLRATVQALQAGSTEERVARLAWENTELRLYLAAVMRVLMDKGIVAGEAIRAAAEAIIAEAGGQSAVANVPLAPPSEADWRGTTRSGVIESTHPVSGAMITRALLPPAPADSAEAGGKLLDRPRPILMRQVLFRIPIPFFNTELPLFGFGFALLVAFFVGVYLANRRARAEGINPDHVFDIALWILFGGIVGARLMSMIVEPVNVSGVDWIWKFFEIWKGGLVFYGAVPGGLLGYAIAYRFIVKKHGLSTLRLADIIAPSIALGIFFGRIGCFLNGCCYGDVVDPVVIPWSVQFPGNSPAQQEFVGRGLQTAYGFVLENEPHPKDAAHKPAIVRAVEQTADGAGLRVGDAITRVWDAKEKSWIAYDDMHIVRIPGENNDEIQIPVMWYYLQNIGLRTPQEPLRVTVRHATMQVEEIDIPPVRSPTLHPAQLYSSLDGVVLFLLLTAFYPFRRKPGQVMGMLMLAYPVNRYLIEQLRADNPPDYGGLTISQAVSIGMIICGVFFMLWVSTRGEKIEPVPTAANPAGK